MLSKDDQVLDIHYAVYRASPAISSALIVGKRIYMLYTTRSSIWQLMTGVKLGIPVGVWLFYVEFFDPGIAK